MAAISSVSGRSTAKRCECVRATKSLSREPDLRIAPMRSTARAGRSACPVASWWDESCRFDHDDSGDPGVAPATSRLGRQDRGPQPRTEEARFEIEPVLLLGVGRSRGHQEWPQALLDRRRGGRGGTLADRWSEDRSGAHLRGERYRPAGFAPMGPVSQSGLGTSGGPAAAISSPDKDVPQRRLPPVLCARSASALTHR